MRTHRKPDLLFTLIVIVGLGIALSSYIQYSRANPTRSIAAVPDAKHPVIFQDQSSNPLVLVANPSHTELRNHDDIGVIVNISPK
jgi:hypothetical protein